MKKLLIALSACMFGCASQRQPYITPSYYGTMCFVDTGYVGPGAPVPSVYGIAESRFYIDPDTQKPVFIQFAVKYQKDQCIVLH
jgi:hypothetical protein